MKILMVTNRLNLFGGAEIYAYVLGNELKKMGHIVEFFGVDYGMKDFGNSYNIYAKKNKNPFRVVRNKKNAIIFSKILDEFKPDVIHLNLIYYTLTPYIIYEAKKRNIPIIQTVHDSKWICPCYQLFDQKNKKPCFECKDSFFNRCVKRKCVKNSFILSFLAAKENTYYLKKDIYKLIDLYVFPSEFMMKLHIEFGFDKKKCISLMNFSRLNYTNNHMLKESNRYVLYFGRVSYEKGMQNLVEICKKLPNINFKIAGKGNCEELFMKLENCELLGFKNGDELNDLISNAILTIYPSIWYENCPLSVIESIMIGTPVVASKIGGIPDIIIDGKTGYLIESDNIDEFANAILKIFENELLRKNMKNNCLNDKERFSLTQYANSIIDLYKKLVER